MIKEESLIQIGLTKNESKVYLALLKIGSATAVELTKASGVHRVNVYDVLERLREKGLISTILQAKKRIYEAADPKQLMSLIKEKEELLDEVLPSLSQDFQMKKEKQAVHQFIGPEGVMQAYYMMLDQNAATIYAIGGSGMNRQYLKHRHEMWNKERIAKGVKGKALYYEFTRREKEKGWHDSSMKVRYLPDSFKTIGMVDVAGNLVINLLPVEGQIMAIVIENKVLADTYRSFFRYMWKFAKE